MRKIILLINFILLSISSYSQNSEIFYSFGNFTFTENSTAFVFGNNVKLRKEPNTSSEELKTLPILQKIVLLKKTEHTHIINGIESIWIKIKTENLTGYILDYFISTSYLLDNNISFLTRINKENEENYLELRKVFKEEKNQLNAEKINIEIPHSNITVKTFDNKGLEGITSIIYIEYMAEACGMEGGGEYLFINKGKIIKRLLLHEVSDAGIFWKTEKLLFPSQNKNLEKNTIKFIQEIGNVIDESSEWYEMKTIERQHRLINNQFVPEFKSKLE